MKGVTYVTVTYLPRAECQGAEADLGSEAAQGCSWHAQVPNYRPNAGRETRKLAQEHAKARGHIVHVITETITEYAPEKAAT